MLSSTARFPQTPADSPRFLQIPPETSRFLQKCPPDVSQAHSKSPLQLTPLILLWKKTAIDKVSLIKGVKTLWSPQEQLLHVNTHMVHEPEALGSNLWLLGDGADFYLLF